jgi:hypothetical protein|nr:MAG TPA: hypothetical protein [Caudoviricetes sp.]
MDEFLTSYQRNISLRDCNIEAKLCIGREGEYGEYPSEPYLDYMKLDVEGFEEQFKNSYIYTNISLRDIAYMVMYSDLEEDYVYTVPCGSFDMVVNSDYHYHGVDVYITIPLKAFITKCMGCFSYINGNNVIDSIFDLYKDKEGGFSECSKKRLN